MFKWFHPGPLITDIPCLNHPLNTELVSSSPDLLSCIGHPYFVNSDRDSGCDIYYYVAKDVTITLGGYKLAG